MDTRRMFAIENRSCLGSLRMGYSEYITHHHACSYPMCLLAIVHAIIQYFWPKHAHLKPDLLRVRVYLAPLVLLSISREAVRDGNFWRGSIKEATRLSPPSPKYDCNISDPWSYRPGADATRQTIMALEVSNWSLLNGPLAQGKQPCAALSHNRKTKPN